MIYVLPCLLQHHLQQPRHGNSLDQQSPIFLAPGTGFIEESFSMDWGRRDSFRVIQMHYIFLCTLFLLLLHQLHLRSSGIRFQKVGTPGLYSRMLVSHEKEWNLVIFNNMNGPWGRYVNQNKSGWERQILYDLHLFLESKSKRTSLVVCG